jgi:hypothetical protein
VLSKLTKNLETIESIDNYLEAFKKCKKFEFIKDVSYNFEQCFNGYFCNTKDLLISKALIIKYYPNGIVKCYNDYNKTPYITKNLIKKDRNLNECLDNLKIDCKHKIDEKKIEDVLDLVKYLKPENREFYNTYLNTYKCK